MQPINLFDPQHRDTNRHETNQRLQSIGMFNIEIRDANRHGTNPPSSPLAFSTPKFGTPTGMERTHIPAHWRVQPPKFRTPTGTERTNLPAHWRVQPRSSARQPAWNEPPCNTLACQPRNCGRQPAYMQTCVRIKNKCAKRRTLTNNAHILKYHAEPLGHKRTRTHAHTHTHTPTANCAAHDLQLYEIKTATM